MENREKTKPGGLIRNASSSWVALFVSQIIALVLTPLLIGELGAEVYGVWLVASNLTGFFAFLDVGLSPAVVSHVAARLAKNEFAAARRVSSSALCLYLLIGLIVLVAFGALGLWADDIFAVPAGQEANARWLILMLGLVVGLGFPVRAYESLLYAEERIAMVNYLDSIRSAVRFAVVAWVVMQSGGLMGLGLAHSAVIMLFYVITIWLVFRYCHRRVLPRLSMEKNSARNLLVFGRDSIAITIANRLVQQGPVLMIGGLAEARDVTVFGLASRLVNNDMILVQSAANVAQPRFAALNSTGQMADVQSILVRSTLWCGLAACCVGLGLWFLSEPFIRLWVGEGFETSALVVRLMIVPVTLSLMLHPCLVLLLGIRRHRAAGVMSIIESLLIVGLCFWLIPIYSAPGAAIAVGAGMILARAWWLPYYTCRRCAMPLGRLVSGGLLRPVLAAALSYAALWLALRNWAVDSWLALVWAAALVVAVFGALAWLVALDSKERRVVMDKIKGLFGRRA